MNKTENRYGYRYLGEGFSVSNDTRITHLNNNDLVVGSSGASKTGSIVYPQLKSLKDSSLIVSDTKGRLEGMFRQELESKGFEVNKIDFINPAQSAKYNPLDYIRRTSDGGFKEQDVAKIAAALVPETFCPEDPFWVYSARNVIEFFVGYALSVLPEEEHDMYSVYQLYRMYISPAGDIPFIQWVKENPDTLAARKYAQISAMKAADKTVSCIYAFVNLAFKPFDYSEYRTIFSIDNSKNAKENNFNIVSLARRKSVLFLNQSDNDHSMDALVNLFYTQTLQTLISEADAKEDGRLEVPVRLIIDDFASGAKLEDFDRIISVVRSRDIWLTMCMQSFTQLQTLYTSAQALTVINNCDHIIYLGSNDLGSAEFIGTRAKKTPEAILSIDRDKEFILEGGKPAQMVNKIPSYAFVEPE